MEYVVTLAPMRSWWKIFWMSRVLSRILNFPIFLENLVDLPIVKAKFCFEKRNFFEWVESFPHGWKGFVLQ